MSKYPVVLVWAARINDIRVSDQISVMTSSGYHEHHTQTYRFCNIANQFQNQRMMAIKRLMCLLSLHIVPAKGQLHNSWLVCQCFAFMRAHNLETQCCPWAQWLSLCIKPYFLTELKVLQLSQGHFFVVAQLEWKVWKLKEFLLPLTCLLHRAILCPPIQIPQALLAKHSHSQELREPFSNSFNITWH